MSMTESKKALCRVLESDASRLLVPASRGRGRAERALSFGLFTDLQEMHPDVEVGRNYCYQNW